MKWTYVKDEKPPLCVNLIFCLEKYGKRVVIPGWDARDTEECDVCFFPTDCRFDDFGWEPIAWMKMPDEPKDAE